MIPMNKKVDALAPHQNHGLDSETRDMAPLAPTTVVLIDDDDDYREELAGNLLEENFGVVEFGDGRAALEFLAAGHGCDVILLDWKMPSVSGAEMLNKFRTMALRSPVIVFTAACDEKTEEIALDNGAADVLDKARRLSILTKKLRIVASRAKVTAHHDAPAEAVARWPLKLKAQTHRAFWRDERVPLTVTEFRIVNLLAARAGEDVPYREIYDVVHGKEFKAGDGANGFHANVRSLIRHIRRKFRSLDAEFAAIENYPGFGYRWRDTDSRRSPKPETHGDTDLWSGEATV